MLVGLTMPNLNGVMGSFAKFAALHTVVPFGYFGSLSVEQP